MIKLPNLSDEETKSIIPENTILLGYVGSISHGTYVPQTDPNCIDDKDIQGICIADKNVYLGLQKFEQKLVQYKEWDSTIHEIKKFFGLLLKNNPNVLALLWLRPGDYIHIHPYGQRIIDNKELFSSQEAYYSFVGYARGQLHRMTHNACEGYMGAKRKALVEKFGYDTKNAAHLIRLLAMGIEFLSTGELRVFRHDRDMLKSIKKGEWSLEKVKSEADRLFALSDEARLRSKLPVKPDYKKVENLLIEILEEHFGFGGEHLMGF
jgi:predicted nucleotidyltransferase